MEEIGEVYARSLFEVAKERDVLDVVHDELGQFADALDSNRDLSVFLFSPYFSTEEKKDGLKRALTGIDPVFKNFLEALIERHRTPAIFRIRSRFEELWDDEKQLLPVEVTSAVQLDPGTVRIDRIARSVSRPAARSSSPARSIRRSSAASCCESATSCWTPRSGTGSTNFASKSHGRKAGASRS